MRTYLGVVSQHGDGEERQSARTGEVVQECQGAGEGVLEVEAGAAVHGRTEVHQHRSGWKVEGGGGHWVCLHHIHT